MRVQPPGQINIIQLFNNLNHSEKMKVFAGLVASALAAPTPVIIGGQNAVDGQFPHQVTLKRASGSHYCGGSIINSDKVCDNNFEVRFKNFMVS